MHIDTATVTGLMSGIGLVAQQMPGVPDDFKTWPVTAMLALIALASLALAFFTIRGLFKLQAEHVKVAMTQAQNAAILNDQIAETNTRLNELCQKQGDLNHELGTRPCVAAKVKGIIRGD